MRFLMHVPGFIVHAIPKQQQQFSQDASKHFYFSFYSSKNPEK